MKNVVITFIGCLLITLSFSSCNSLEDKYFGGTYIRKPYTIDSPYGGLTKEEAEKFGDPYNAKKFLQVYCEDDFNFKEAGILEGSFKLSRKTSFDWLEFWVWYPKLRDQEDDAEIYYYSHLSIPMNIKYEWSDKKGNIHYAYSTNNGRNMFDYVPLPKETEIKYTLSYDKGTYENTTYQYEGEEGISYGLFYYENGDIDKPIDKTADINNNPEKYEGFYDGKFRVVER